MEEQEIISEEIINNAIQGNDEAIEIIYKAYYRKVFMTSVQFLGNEEKAKDVVQEVFVRVFKNLKDLKNIESLNSWIYKITYNQCHNSVRRKTRIVDLYDEDFVENYPDDKRVDYKVMESIEYENIQKIVMDTLDTMSLPMKEVAVLRFFDELKISEIAEVLDIPKSTVSTRLIRIKKKLSYELKKKGVHSEENSIIMAVFMKDAFQGLCDIYMNNLSAELPSSFIVDAITDVSLISQLFSIKGIVTAIVSVTVILGISTFVGQEENLKEEPILKTMDLSEDSLVLSTKHNEVEVDMISTAKIQAINYDKTWTNSKVEIIVETTNNNYDSILINGINTRYINNNGTYLVELIFEGEVIDSQSISIHHIDRKSPTLKGEEKGNQFILYMEDNISGLDWDKTEHFCNGELSNNYQIDYLNQSIIIDNDYNYSTHKIIVFDQAGNSITIKIE